MPPQWRQKHLPPYVAPWKRRNNLRPPFATVAYLNTKAASFFNFHQLFFFFKGAFIFVLILRAPEFPGNTWFLFIPDRNLCTKPIKLELPPNKCFYHFKAIETVCKHIYICGRYGKMQIWGFLMNVIEKNILKSCKKAIFISCSLTAPVAREN